MKIKNCTAGSYMLRDSDDAIASNRVRNFLISREIRDPLFNLVFRELRPMIDG